MTAKGALPIQEDPRSHAAGHIAHFTSRIVSHCLSLPLTVARPSCLPHVMPQAPFVVLGNSPSHPALQAPHAQPPPRHPGDQWPPSPPHCGPLEGPDRHLSLRVVSIFVIFAASTLATLLPILASRVRARRRSSTSADSNGNNGLLLDFFKHFGSGVIISTVCYDLKPRGVTTRWP